MVRVHAGQPLLLQTRRLTQNPIEGMEGALNTIRGLIES